MLSKSSSIARSKAIRPLGLVSSHHARESAVAKASQHRWQQLISPVRPAAFSSVSAASPKSASASSSSTTTTSSSTPAAANKDAPVRDFFLDNLGKIFLSAIGLVIASLVRSSYGTSNMKEVREEVEADSALDPIEISDLRQANSELTLDLFRTIMKTLENQQQQQNSMSMTYPEFVQAVRAIMQRVKGEGVTIGMGHLLDRVVMKKLTDQLKATAPKEVESKGANNTSTTESSFSSSQWETTQQQGGTADDPVMPLSFWLTVLSLALNGPVPDRIRILYEIMELDKQTQTQTQSIMDISISSHDNDKEVQEGQVVTLGEVKKMVGHLQDTCQLVPDKTVVPTETKYPVQQYKRGTPEELVQWEGDDGDDEVLDVDAFAGILRSKSVCAWGECYHRKKYVP